MFVTVWNRPCMQNQWLAHTCPSFLWALIKFFVPEFICFSMRITQHYLQIHQIVDASILQIWGAPPTSFLFLKSLNSWCPSKMSMNSAAFNESTHIDKKLVKNARSCHCCHILSNATELTKSLLNHYPRLYSTTNQYQILVNLLVTKAFFLQSPPLQSKSCCYSIHRQTVKQLNPPPFHYFVFLNMAYFVLHLLPPWFSCNVSKKISIESRDPITTLNSHHVFFAHSLV